MPTSKPKIIPYGRQSIDQDDIDAVVRVLHSDFLTQGPAISKFENEFAKFIGCKHAIAVSNGTAALHLSALALGVSKGDRVITTPITFAASANCIKYCEGEVVFCDIDPKTYLIDLDKLESMIESKPRNYYSGIVPVDFTGLPVDTERIRKITNKHDLWIIEDACHAPGGYRMDSSGSKIMCGSGIYSDCSIYSFHPVKHIAAGEGGLITTDDDELADKLRILRTHGITKDEQLMDQNDGGWYYEMKWLGYNYRLSDIQAALASTQLSKIDYSLKRRNEIATRYSQAFHGMPIETQEIPEGNYHAYHLYVIKIADRKGLYDFLRDKGIFCQVHYIPVHTLPYYQSLGHKRGELPVAEEYYSQCLSIPMYPTLSDEDQQFVIDQIKIFFNVK